MSSAESLPVSVLLERRLAGQGMWREWQWSAVAVVVGEHLGATRSRTVVDAEAERLRVMWTGLELALHRDGCESYWHNLMSGSPSLFVVCFGADEAADGEEIHPVLVTASQDEANAHMESDDPVFSVPMPDPVRERVERYVVMHYEPQMRRKRTRVDWAEDSKYAQRDARRGGRD